MGQPVKSGAGMWWDGPNTYPASGLFAGVKLLPVDADATGMITAYYRSGGSPSPLIWGYPLPYTIYALPDTEIEPYAGYPWPMACDRTRPMVLATAGIVQLAPAAGCPADKGRASPVHVRGRKDKYAVGPD